uniref:Uncharacterized protein n=1 Tax=Panagrolaimus sp. PS1159 TaxID=55785 RepID=A0AC35GBD6_9BILA
VDLRDPAPAVPPAPKLVAQAFHAVQAKTKRWFKGSPHCSIAEAAV